MRSRTAFLSLLVALFVLLPSAPSAVQAQTVDLPAASAAAHHLSVLESQSSWDALYDQLHPDSQLTVDRATVAYWYETYFGINGPQPAGITSVSLKSWTWPVTGRTYPQTAEVAYTQDFDNGSTVQDVVRLVQATDGSWRWFFGRSPEFVQQISQEAAQPGPPASIPDRTGIGPQSLFAEAIAAIDSVPTACFVGTGLDSVPPSIGFDSMSSQHSTSGVRPESVSFLSPGSGGFPALIVNALTLQPGETPESVVRKIDASRVDWDGPPYTLPPRALYSDLSPTSASLIFYYEEYNEATGYLPVLAWGPHGTNKLFTVVGPAAGLINGLVAEWSANAESSCQA
ncbi:MAG: hypothetical protein KC438_11800 [Thermomicrobiales bacterium]|nr:hypothetical protein [Thermomicrobiales bacterium]